MSGCNNKNLLLPRQFRNKSQFFIIISLFIFNESFLEMRKVSWCIIQTVGRIQIPKVEKFNFNIFIYRDKIQLTGHVKEQHKHIKYSVSNRRNFKFYLYVLIEIASNYFFNSLWISKKGCNF